MKIRDIILYPFYLLIQFTIKYSEFKYNCDKLSAKLEYERYYPQEYYKEQMKK